MNEGDVILVPLPQADGKIKPRPAILLRIVPPFDDFLVCGVSTQIRQQVVGFDETITARDSDYILSGLRQESLIRLGFVAVFAQRQVLGSIGEISPQRHRELLKRLADFLVSNQKSA